MLKFLFLLCLGLVEALPGGAAPASAVAVGQQSCGTHVVAGDSDNGSSVCVVAGSDVSILLTAVAGSSWSAPTVTGRALGPAMPLPTPYGRVGWQFRALTAGPAEIRTTRPGCPAPATPAADCQDIVYRLHVTVR